jgi:hypothetical protein
MPYEIRKAGNEWEVTNKDTKQSKGKSKSREMAVRHLRALYATEGISKGLKAK